MPSIKKEFKIELDANKVYGIIPLAVQASNGQITEQKIKQSSPFLAHIKIFFTSVWGWGGMNIDITLEEQQGKTNLALEGYIAQLATSPLRKAIDSFINSLSLILKEKYNYNLMYTPDTTYSLMSFKWNKWNKADTMLIIIIIGSLGLIMTLSLILGINDSYIGILLLPVAYYFGKKYLKKTSQ